VGESSVAQSARVHVGVHVKSRIEPEGQAGPGGSLVMAEGSSLKINAHIDTLIGGGGGGRIVLEEGASLKINAHVGTLVAGGGGGTIVVGAGASLQINLHAETMVAGAGRLEVADGASVKLNLHAKPEPVKLELPPIASRKAAPAAEKEGEGDDPLKDIKDLRWRLLRDVIATFERHAREAAERGDQRHGHGHGHGKGLALGHRGR
jgi:hypothetical protein